MFTDHLFHPNHVIPASKLLAALVEVGHSSVAELFMEAYAVLRQIVILGLDEGDAGIHIKDALSL